MQPRHIAIAAGAAIAAFGVAFVVARAAGGGGEVQAGEGPQIIERRSAEIAAATGTADDLPPLAAEPTPAPQPPQPAGGDALPPPAPVGPPDLSGSVTPTTPLPAPPPPPPSGGGGGTTDPPPDDDDDGGVIIGGSED